MKFPLEGEGGGTELSSLELKLVNSSQKIIDQKAKEEVAKGSLECVAFTHWVVSCVSITGSFIT